MLPISDQQCSIVVIEDIPPQTMMEQLRELQGNFYSESTIFYIRQIIDRSLLSYAIINYEDYNNLDDVITIEWKNYNCYIYPTKNAPQWVYEWWQEQSFL